MPATKRKSRRGGARPGAGRPESPETRSRRHLTVRLLPADEERLGRLSALWEATEADTVRRALEMADDMLREG